MHFHKSRSKMKTLKLTVMALMLITAGAGMSACSSSDEEKTAEQVTDPIQSNVEYYIEGQVTSGENGIAGVTVSTTGYDAVTTDENGRFILTVKEAKDYTLNFSKDGYLNKSTTASLSGLSNRSVKAVSLNLSQLEPTVAIATGSNYLVEPGAAKEVQNSGSMTEVSRVGIFIPKETISEAAEISMTAYIPETSTLASTQGQMSSPVMGIYFTATKGSITATEENPIILAVNNPSASTILTGMEIYQTAPVSGRADTDGYLGTATYDETSDSYQLKLTSGTLEGGYEFMIPTTRTVGAKQTEVVKEGTLDNSGNLTANKDVTINYTTQLGWEFKGEEASTLSSLLYNAILSHEGSEGMFDVTFDKKTQVSGESILYWKAVMNFNDVTYTFPTTEGNISATLTRYNGIDFTYTIEDGRHSGGTSNSGN